MSLNTSLNIITLDAASAKYAEAGEAERADIIKSIAANRQHEIEGWIAGRRDDSDFYVAILGLVPTLLEREKDRALTVPNQLFPLGEIVVTRGGWRATGAFLPLGTLLERAAGAPITTETHPPKYYFDTLPHISQLIVYRRNSRTNITYDSRGLFSLPFIQSHASPQLGGLDENLIRRMNTVKLHPAMPDASGQLVTEHYTRPPTGAALVIIVETFDNVYYRILSRTRLPSDCTVPDFRTSLRPPQYHGRHWGRIRHTFFDERILSAATIEEEAVSQDALVFDIKSILLGEFDNRPPKSAAEFIEMVSDQEILRRAIVGILIETAQDGHEQRVTGESAVSYASYVHTILTTLSIEMAAHPISFMSDKRYGDLVSGRTNSNLRVEYERVLDGILPVLHKSGILTQRGGTFKNSIINGFI